MSRFNDGWVIMLNVFWFEAVLFNRWGIYVLVSDPDGETFWGVHEMKQRDIEFATDTLFFREGDNTVYVNGDVYTVKLDIDDFSCSLDFSNFLTPGNPGDGVYYLSEDRKAFQRRIINCPWADVSGSMTNQRQRDEGRRPGVR